ncbi:oxygenase MpaB family protein [Kamptonema cortianum]|nr:oxygenase MpaB family protein [Kamptonema cortianum]
MALQTGDTHDGVFPATSVIWKITREHCILLYGPAAAILQIAHPQIARGVARYSGFRADAWGRLVRTLDTVYTVTFGVRAEAEMIRERMIGMHRGIELDGGRKNALDPELQFWVLATLVMASIEGYENVVGAICAEDKEAFYQDMRVFGEYFGLPPGYGPEQFAQFEPYYSKMIGGDLLGSDPLCAQLARDIAAPRKPLWLALAMKPVGFIVVETLPGNLRERLGFRSTKTTRACWRVMTHLLRCMMRILPSCLRFARRHREALNRMGGR